MRNKLIYAAGVLLLVIGTATAAYFIGVKSQKQKVVTDTIMIQVDKIIQKNDTIYKEIVKEAEKIKTIQKKYEKDYNFISNAKLDTQRSFFSEYLSKANQ